MSESSHHDERINSGIALADFFDQIIHEYKKKIGLEGECAKLNFLGGKNVGNVSIFVMLKFENKLDGEISHFNCNSYKTLKKVNLR